MTWNIEIENVAGIRNGKATIKRGLNAVQASNWQGKSSFITAIETAVGTEAQLTEGEDHGQVVLETENDTLTTELYRQNGEVHRRGDQLLQDDQDLVCAELFAFLDEWNEIRSLVREGQNLEEALTRPLDLENIDEQIRDLREEREQIDRELERAETAAKKLPSLEEEIHQLEADLEELREEREELIDQEGKSASASGKREELSEVRSERDQVENRIERLEDTIERTRSRLEEKRAELEDLEVPDVDLESELAQAHEEIREIESNMELLQSVYETNERVLEEDRLEFVTEVDHGIAGDTVECWVCNSEVQRSEIKSQLQEFSERIRALQNDVESSRDRIEELESKQSEAKQKRRRKKDLEQEIADLETTLQDREESLESARDRLDELETRLEELSESVADTSERLTDLESEIKYIEADLEDKREERESLEEQANQREMLEDERDTIAEEIEELRTRKETTKRELRESFDESMQEILSRFDTGFENARLTAGFDIVVAREGREAELSALSEAEVELIGIVAALAGYETFDVSDRTPILLLDGVGLLAREHLHTLVEYLRDRATYFVTTAMPQQGTFEGNVLDPGEWDVVSHPEVPEPGA